jgi:hypothetical protein
MVSTRMDVVMTLILFSVKENVSGGECYRKDRNGIFYNMSTRKYFRVLQR